MVVTYQRSGRLSVLGALAAGAVVVMLMGIATVTMLILGVVACGLALGRAIRRLAGARPRAEDDSTIAGTVVESIDVSPRRLPPGAEV